MQEEHTKNANEENADASPTEGKRKREQSSIQFPYGDLNDAIDFVKAINQVGGQSCQLEQLAGYLKVAPNGGGFRARLSYPRIFGLAQYERGGTVSLTPLGMRIIDPSQESAARAEAFLNVELYRAIYDKYKGFQLPPPAALEREMVALGVSSKQKDKARQAFDRSAKQAGFYWASNDRLTMPVVKDKPETRPLEGHEEQPESKKKGSGGGGGYHPFIEGLLKELPESGAAWPHSKRVKWLRLAANAFDMIYEGEGAIEIRDISNANGVDRSAA
jgi:hypothetical protein